MPSKEISFWINERWYNALSRHLKDETLEEHLEDVIDQMCNQLPEHEYERISREIWQEDQANKQAAEAARRFAVLHVTENQNSTYFVAEENLEMLQVSVRLRNYIRKHPEKSPTQFTGMFSRGEKISLEQYNAYVLERLENTGRVTGAFDIDLDKGRFDALHIMDGWQCFRIQDVSTAAYFAMKKSGAHQEERWKVFLDRLDGKQLTAAPEVELIHGSRQLQSGDIYFSEDIIQNANLLEFYMDVVFDAEEIFGSSICAGGEDDFLNIYANYNLETGHVCDTLAVVLSRDNGSEQCFKYQLSDEEKALLLPRMDAYCQHKWNQSLEECRSDYLKEQETITPTLQM